MINCNQYNYNIGNQRNRFLKIIQKSRFLLVFNTFHFDLENIYLLNWIYKESL